MTSNIRGSSICSPKSLYKKISNEILTELKAVVKTGTLKVPRPRPVLTQSATTYLWDVCQTASSQPTPPTPPRARKKKNATKMNFSSFSNHSWIINDCYIFFLSFEFEYFLFYGLLSLQHKTLVLWYRSIDTTADWKKTAFPLIGQVWLPYDRYLSVAVHAFASRELMSFSVDETLLSWYVNLSTSFRELPLSVEMSPLWLKHIYSVLCELT